MDLIFLVVPIALGIAGFFLAAFLWSVKSGQLDDLESPAVRMLHDDEPRAVPLEPVDAVDAVDAVAPQVLDGPGSTCSSATTPAACRVTAGSWSPPDPPSRIER